MQRVFRYSDGARYNILALVYMLAAYSLGFMAILSDKFVLNITGIITLAHAMVIAAYLVHECAHNSIFRKNRYHRWLAEVLLWICGASYSHYDDIRQKHVRHHTDHADIVSFDYRIRLQKYPKLLKTISQLEWFYVPALEIAMHALVIVLPFIKANRAHRRLRVTVVLSVRILMFYWLSQISLLVLFFYPLSYMLFLTVMRFMDVHQHTYDLYETLDQPRGEEARKYNREFEQKNTFSNLISVKYPWFNLLVLNFPYHNAHHAQPGRPWHQLPDIHKDLFADNQQQILPFRSLLKSFHQYRVLRILNADPVNMQVKGKEEQFVGVDGVSFLTAH